MTTGQHAPQISLPAPRTTRPNPCRRRVGQGVVLLALAAVITFAAVRDTNPAGNAAYAQDAAPAELYVPLALRGAQGAFVQPTARPTHVAPTGSPSATPAPTGAAPSPPAAALGQRSFKSGPVQVTADGSVLWVAHAHGDDVWRVRTGDGTLERFPLGGSRVVRDRPMGVSVTEDGDEVWVAARDSDRVYVLDGATGARRSVLQLPWGSGPVSVALQPPDVNGRQRLAVVALHRGDAVAVYDVATREQLLLAPTFRTPHGIAWLEDGRSAWLTHLLSGGEHPRLTRIEVVDGEPVITTRLRMFATHPQHSDALSEDDSARNVAEGGYLNWRGHPAQLPSEVGPAQLWLPTQYHNMNASVYGPDSTMQATLRKLDLRDHRLLVEDKVVLTARHVHDPRRTGDSPWLGYGWDTPVAGLADLGFVRLDGRVHAVTIGEHSENLVMLPTDSEPWRSRDDARAPGLPHTSVGTRPMGLALSPTRPEAYVYNATSGTVSIVELNGPNGPVERETLPLSEPVPGDLLSDPVLRRGAELFHTSADERLSSNAKVSCASCHIHGESDGRHWNFESLPPGTARQGHGPRRTVDLRGFGGTLLGNGRDPATGFGLVHRSGDRDEVQDFEHTIRGPLMGGRGFLGDAVQPELGAPNAGRDPDLDALAAFVEALPPVERSPHRQSDGSLSQAAIRGATMFLGEGDRPADARCASCHVPETDFQDFGFHDVGSRRPSSEQELDAAHRSGCRWCVNTPSLRGAWYHAPWEGAWRWTGSMLEHMTDFADPARPAPHGRTAGLTLRQRHDLSAFVLSIDGDLEASRVRALADTSPPAVEAVLLTSPTRLEVFFDETIDPTWPQLPQAWAVRERGGGSLLTVHDVRYHAQIGDRLTLIVEPLRVGHSYEVRPVVPIRDVADRVSGGRANALDPADPAVARMITVTEVLTITLGGSGYEHLSVPVHDAAPVGPNLRTWSHSSLWMGLAGDDPIPGFVRFDWQDAFVEATGVTRPEDLVDARFTMDPLRGDVQRLEARRVLQAWSDGEGASDFRRSARGAPTWRDHQHPDGRWNGQGASVLGGTGDGPADYHGAFDLAGVLDAEVRVRSLSERFAVAGPRVTEAYRLWLQHPEIDFGHALRIMPEPPHAPVLKLHPVEADHGTHSPVLQIAYRVSSSGP